MRLRVNNKGTANAVKTALKLCAALLLLACARASFAETGGMAGSIFSYGAGARPLALGGAWTAMAHDSMGAYYNPAGLALLPGSQVSFMHAALFEGAAYDFVGLSKNYKRVPGGYGLYLVRTSIGGVDGRDANNVPTGSVDYSEMGLGAGMGVRGILLPRLSLGAGGKFLNRSLGSSSDKQLGVDLAAQYGPILLDKVNVGLNARNILGLSSGDTLDKLDPDISFGVSAAPFEWLLVLADVTQSAGLRAGIEYAPKNWAVRAGYDGGYFTFGVGMKLLSSFDVDIAMLKHPDLGNTTRVSLAYRFAGARAKDRPRTETYSRDLLKLFKRDFENLRYAAALNDLERAMGLDPKLEKTILGEQEARLKKLVQAMNFDTQPAKERIFASQGEQTALAHAAVIAYLNGLELRSIVLAHCALGANTKNAIFEELLMVLSQFTGQPVRKDEILSKNAFVQHKLKRSLLDFNARKFEVAIRELQELLIIDENNTLALTRLGSSYYAIGDMDKARATYEAVLKLNPDDRSVRSFMNLKGWTPPAETPPAVAPAAAETAVSAAPQP